LNTDNNNKTTDKEHKYITIFGIPIITRGLSPLLSLFSKKKQGGNNGR